MFSGKRYSLTELSRSLDCSKQTVIRILNDIRMAYGVDIEETFQRNRKYCRIKRPSSPMPIIPLTEKEETFTVEVEFTGWSACYVAERIWSPDQEITKEEDRSSHHGGNHEDHRHDPRHPPSLPAALGRGPIRREVRLLLPDRREDDLPDRCRRRGHGPPDPRHREGTGTVAAGDLPDPADPRASRPYRRVRPDQKACPGPDCRPPDG